MNSTEQNSKTVTVWDIETRTVDIGTLIGNYLGKSSEWVTGYQLRPSYLTFTIYVPVRTTKTGTFCSTSVEEPAGTFCNTKPVKCNTGLSDRLTASGRAVEPRREQGAKS